jgi:outer membrane protein assembly factor BamB
LSGPMDSPWPMYGHDGVHTGRSPYSTENNTGVEIWRVRGDETGGVWSSAVIDNNEMIYFGTKGADGSLYALYSNGTRKWRYPIDGVIWCTPAIAEDGTLYFTTWGAYHYFYALNSNGTAKWLFAPGDSSTSSPAIADDGTIYFGSDDHFIYAINPNGTEKWRYITGFYVNGAPAIGQDGTIYIGSGDHYFYALNPNGTLRWRFGPVGEIKGSASIAPDGTIYVPSFGGYFYALYPNGTMKWQASTGGIIASAGVALAEDGTIYVGTEVLRAYYPNGTLKWSTDVQGNIYGTVPAVSADGTIYVSAGGSLVAVNPDGTEKWRKQLTIAQIHSSPCIGPDDRVYVGSEDYWGMKYGYLHAFGLGQPKDITIEQPRRNHWYLFSKDMGKTMTDNLVIVGSVTVKVNASIEHEIDHIDFYIAHFRDVEPEYQIQYTDTEAPYEWTMNKRYGNDVFPALPFDRLSIKVIGWYKGGCTWSEEITNFWYFHLKK